LSARAKLSQIELGALLGAVSAVLGTVFHQAWIQGFPYGLLISFGLLTMSFLSLRRYRSRLGSWVGVVVLAVLIFVFSLPGTDVMIPANFAGIAWSYGSITWAVLITAFPKLGLMNQRS
jgi:hypothetical protein